MLQLLLSDNDIVDKQVEGFHHPHWKNARECFSCRSEMILDTGSSEIWEKETWDKGEINSNSKSVSKFSWLFEGIIYLGFQIYT